MEYQQLRSLKKPADFNSLGLRFDSTNLVLGKVCAVETSNVYMVLNPYSYDGAANLLLYSAIFGVSKDNIVNNRKIDVVK